MRTIDTENARRTDSGEAVAAERATPCCPATEQATCCTPADKPVCCGTPEPAREPSTACGCR